MVCRSQKVLQHRSQICRILIACIWSAPCTFRVNPCWSWEHLERGNPHALLQFVVDFNDDRPITPFPSIKQPVTIDISSWAFTEHLDWLQGTVLPVFIGDIFDFRGSQVFFFTKGWGKKSSGASLSTLHGCCTLEQSALGTLTYHQVVVWIY